MTSRIAHFTDVHVVPNPSELQCRDLLGKTALGWFNLRCGRRRDAFQQTDEIVRALGRDLAIEQPDHLLFTGDATCLAHPSEFDKAALLLDAARGRIPATALPGNHDRYTRAATAIGRFESAFGAWLTHRTPAGPPHVRLVGEHVAILTIEDARPTALWDSSGKVGVAQLQRLETLLRDPCLDRRAVIVALHHGPLRQDGRPDRRFHGLRDAREFLAVIERSRVDIVVFGHLHERVFLPASKGRSVPLTTPGSLTHAAHERAYHIYEVDGPGRLRLVARRYDAKLGAFVAWPEAPGSGTLP
jgi:3',5'-cyclic AMP phosphodiesterase CpdA